MHLVECSGELFDEEWVMKEMSNLFIIWKVCYPIVPGEK